MIPPAVASPDLSPRQAVQIQNILLSIADDPAAIPVLAALGVDRFVMVDDGAYDEVRQLIESAKSIP
jgi:ABC-type phosphate/phosphonate transport system substrate-binding protein